MIQIQMQKDSLNIQRKRECKVISESKAFELFKYLDIKALSHLPFAIQSEFNQKVSDNFTQSVCEISH